MRFGDGLIKFLGVDRRTFSRIVLAFLATNTLVLLFLRHIAYRDPTSVFFRPSIAYDRKYSRFRQDQAEAYVAASNTLHHVNNTKTTPRLCVGVPSVAREGVSYLKATIGSVLEGLTQKERDELYLIVFIAVTKPDRHPAYREPWLDTLADKVLTYDLPAEQFKHVEEMEREKALFREKGMFDYTYLLKECLKTQAEHVAIFEDDVLAMDGWYHRTIDGLEQADHRSSRKGYIYLRLFYTEEFLGWNSEHLTSHIVWSLLTIGLVGIFLDRLRAFSPAIRRSLTSAWILVICAIVVPWLVALYFMTGRVTVMPLPQGINTMNNYGCCSQGLVFPPAKARQLVEHYENTHVGFIDMVTEQYADEHQEQRWALTPSVLQHIGLKSSKGDDLGEMAKHNRPVAAKLWNFAFETNNEHKLHSEHVQYGGG